MAWTERYCSPSGGGLHDGTSEANAWTWAEAAANYAAGHRINCIAGTYSETAIVQFSTAGTDTSPVWIRGYNSTIGDLDDAPTSQRTPGTDMPLISHTSNYSIILNSATHLQITGMAFETSVSAHPALYFYPKGKLLRCRFNHTGTGSTSRAFTRQSGTGYTHCCDCHFETASTTASAVFLSGGVVHTFFTRCTFEGGDENIDQQATFCRYRKCKFMNANTVGILTTTGGIWADECTFYNTGTDGIESTGLTIYSSEVSDCYFHTIGGYAINNSSGGDTDRYLIHGNAYYNLTSGQLNGIAENVQFNEQTDSADEFVNAGTGDVTLTSDSNGYGVATLFEKDGPTTYDDVGAVQHEDAGGGGIKSVGSPAGIF